MKFINDFKYKGESPMVLFEFIAPVVVERS